MRLRNTEWPKVFILLACVAVLSYCEGAEAKSVKSFQDEWKALCIEHALERCPTLEIYPDSRRGLFRVQGETSCGFRKWEDERKERACFNVEVWRNAAPETLDHEMAHVLQWLGGDNEGGHGRSFRRAYVQITGRSYQRPRRGHVAD